MVNNKLILLFKDTKTGIFSNLRKINIDKGPLNSGRANDFFDASLVYFVLNL